MHLWYSVLLIVHLNLPWSKFVETMRLYFVSFPKKLSWCFEQTYRTGTVMFSQWSQILSTSQKPGHSYMNSHPFIIHVNLERMFRGTNSGPSSEARCTPEGGFGGPPPEIFKNLYCKWCNLSYSWTIFYYVSIQLGYIVIINLHKKEVIKVHVQR